MELVEINNKNPAVMDFEKLIIVIKKASKVKPVSISFVTVADMETDDVVQNLSPSPASMSKTNGRVDDDRLKFDNNYKEDVNDSNNSNNNGMRLMMIMIKVIIKTIILMPVIRSTLKVKM